MNNITADLLSHPSAYTGTDPLPPDFVLLQEVIPDIVIDLKYASTDNFIGEPALGYEHARAILTRPAARALQAVQDQLRPQGIGLKIFDAYRPQRTVNFFIQWAANHGDTRMKEHFYPAVAKEALIPDGYIARQSGHSRGSTVDLTLVRLSDRSELDMGTPFDFFGPQSWTRFGGVSHAQKKNRELLQKIMTAHGFTGVQEEWWHFTLNNEPFPDTYFNFTSG